MKVIRWIERFSGLASAFCSTTGRATPSSGCSWSPALWGAFLAPPFTGLDTLPSLGVVLLSLGVLLEDFAVVASG